MKLTNQQQAMLDSLKSHGPMNYTQMRYSHGNRNWTRVFHSLEQMKLATFDSSPEACATAKYFRAADTND